MLVEDGGLNDYFKRSNQIKSNTANKHSNNDKIYTRLFFFKWLSLHTTPLHYHHISIDIMFVSSKNGTLCNALFNVRSWKWIELTRFRYYQYCLTNWWPNPNNLTLVYSLFHCFTESKYRVITSLTNMSISFNQPSRHHIHI
jgi:hypothetical protein